MYPRPHLVAQKVCKNSWT